MFTGLIEEIGIILSVSVHPTTHQTILVIQCSVILPNIAVGDSISVNGVCLTVTSFTSSTITVGLSPETLRRTTFQLLKSTDAVNLERSLTPSSHIGGHYVQGHVDGVGSITTIQQDGDAMKVIIATTPALIKFIVEKGYIAVDGTSLTVVNVNTNNNSFEVMLIQFTQQKVILSRKRIGDKVNLETDILGKQIVAHLERYLPQIKAQL